MRWLVELGKRLLGTKEPWKGRRNEIRDPRILEIIIFRVKGSFSLAVRRNL